MIEAELLDSGTQRGSKRLKGKLEAYDLRSRMYYTMKIQDPFTTGTQGRLSPWPSASLPVLLRMGFFSKHLDLGNWKASVTIQKYNPPEKPWN